MTQKGRQERVRMRSERWRLLGGNLLMSLSMPLALSPNRGLLLSLEPKLRSWRFPRYWWFNKQYCKEAKLQARIKPTALCSAIDKENLIESPLDFATLYIHLLSWLCTLPPTVLMPVSWLLCHMLWLWPVTMCDMTVTWPFCDFGHICDSVTVMWYFPHSTLVII